MVTKGDLVFFGFLFLLLAVLYLCTGGFLAEMFGIGMGYFFGILIILIRFSREERT